MGKKNNNIRLFAPHFLIKEVLSEIEKCLKIGWTGIGFKTLEFEEKFKEYTGLPHAHFTNSATAALHLAVNILKRNYGWKDEDEIITTPITFISTNHAILYEKLKPIFADVDEFLCLDPKSVESRISKKTKAVMFVGMGGNVGRLKEIIKICKKHKLKLILDAAHMTGTRWKKTKKHIGSEAAATIFSFQAVKNLPTADSGMVCFKSHKLDKEARKLSWVGIDKDTYSRFSSKGYGWYYNVDYLGYKYHGNSVIAAIALVSLKYVDKDNEYRRKIAHWYDKAFENHEIIKLVPHNPECISSRHLYQILVPSRDKLIVEMGKLGISLGVHYRDNTEYNLYAKYRTKCPNASAKSKLLVTLPDHLEMNRDDITRITNSIKSFFGK